MSSFDIRNHVDFKNKGRAQCPCCLLDGKKEANLSVMDSGAYKCHRGHTPVEIREQLGQPKTASPTEVQPSITKLSTYNQLKAGRERLQSSKNALPWLLERGITREMIAHYGLVAVRASTPKGGHLPAVGIPIEIEPERYAIKKRIEPWTTTDSASRGDAPPWSQYGIGCRIFWGNKPAAAQETWLVEGEWDAMALGWMVGRSELAEAVAVAAFTGGAGNIPNGFELDLLPTGPITTFYDLDKPGEDGAAKLAKRLGDRVKIGKVPAPAEAPTGWDVSDAINKGGSALIDFVGASAGAQPLPAPAPDRKPNALRDRLTTNDQLLARAEDYTDWLVPDILTPNELFLMAAPPRTGKSLFCLTLAKAVATGGKFLDRPCTQGAVLYVNLEDSESKVKIRQIQQGWDAGLPVYWIDQFKLNELDDLAEVAREIPNLRLIILDTFSRIRSDSGKESGSEIGRVLEPLQEMAKVMGVCVLLTHHTSKLNAETAQGSMVSPFDLIRGNSSLRGTARGAIVILPAEDSYRICVENGYSDDTDMRARINPSNLTWQLMGRWSPRIEGSIRDQVMDYLNLNGQGSVRQISSDLALQASTVGTILSKLQGEDLITKVGGTGRTPAIYVRSFNLLQLGETAIETYTPYIPMDTALLQRPQDCMVSTEKVITPAKSDQKSDHFAKNTPDTNIPLKQSYSPDSASGPCFNAPSTELKQIEASRKPELSIGARINAKRRGQSDLRDCMVTAIGLSPVLSALTSKLSPGVQVKRHREHLIVALADCEVIA
jgi:hypothetical protein